MGSEDNRVLTKSEFAEHMGWMQGKQEGIGAEFSFNSHRTGLLITEVFEEGPADQEGLAVGDSVVSQNGPVVYGSQTGCDSPLRSRQPTSINKVSSQKP